MKDDYIFLAISITTLILLKKVLNMGNKWGNNPLNIRGTFHDKTKWVGEREGARNAKNYLEFTHPKYSFRAAYKIMDSYRRRGVVTVRSIIETYAPEEDNNHTENYISYICHGMSISPDTVVTNKMRPQMMALMSDFETGNHGRFTPSMVYSYLKEFGFDV